MKRIILTSIILFFADFMFAQDIIIDIQGQIIKDETTVPAQEIKIKIINPLEDKKYEISSIINRKNFEPLKFPEAKDSIKEKNLSLEENNVLKELSFKLRRGETLTIVIKEYDADSKEVGVIERKYITRESGKWQTTFGFNMVWINADTYFSEQQDDTFLISPSNREQSLEFHPTIMFTWLGFGKEDSVLKDSNVGLSAGFGYDLEESFSLFSGISYVYKQNLTFTVGAAFVHQAELNRQYGRGDIITENLDFDQLHEDFLRIRPFVSISLRLDKSPF